MNDKKSNQRFSLLDNAEDFEAITRKRRKDEFQIIHSIPCMHKRFLSSLNE